MKRSRFMIAISALAACWLAMTTAMATTSNWLAVFVASLVPIVIMAVAIIDEGGSLKRMFDPRRASWAFLADPFVAASAAAFTVAQATSPDRQPWVQQWLTSLAIAVIAGVLGALAIRAFDRPRYARHKASKKFFHSCKIIHDFLVLPVLTGTTCATALQATLAGAFNNAFWVGLSLLGIWLAGGIKDLVREPNPHEQHPTRS